MHGKFLRNGFVRQLRVQLKEAKSLCPLEPGWPSSAGHHSQGSSWRRPSCSPPARCRRTSARPFRRIRSCLLRRSS